MDEQKLAEFWDKEVPEHAKHLHETVTSRVGMRCSADITRLLSRVNFSSVDMALDWGCGGGWGANVLADHFNVAILDIVPACLRATEKLMTPVASYELTSLDNLKILQKIDLILCSTVIYHFPSYAYWKKVVAFWKN